MLLNEGIHQWPTALKEIRTLAKFRTQQNDNVEQQSSVKSCIQVQQSGSYHIVRYFGGVLHWRFGGLRKNRQIKFHQY